MSTTISKAENLVELIERMPPDSVLIQHGVSWDEYEELLKAVGEASSLRISYDDGTLQIMTVSFKHEKYVRTIERMVDLLSLRLRIKVLFYGSATMKKDRKKKGVEPDACFYVEKAALVGTKDEIDLSTDPPPDVVVEIDLHHESLSKFPIYAALGVPEVWRYDGDSLAIYQLHDEQYVESKASQSLPLLTTAVLTGFLARIPKQDQYDIMLAFEEWLNPAAVTSALSGNS
jgi:Uma2 family endonuclease